MMRNLLLICCWAWPALLLGQTRFATAGDEASAPGTVLHALLRPGVAPDVSSLADGRWVLLSDAQDTTSRLIVVLVRDGQLHGVLRQYAPGTGRLLRETTFERGVRQGPERRWHPTGERASEVFYVQGVLHGPIALFDDRGRVLRQGHIHRGIADSVWTHWITGYNDGAAMVWLDSAQRSERWRLSHGQAFLLDAWDEHGQQTVVAGNGVRRPPKYAQGTEHYADGLLDDMWTGTFGLITTVREFVRGQLVMEVQLELGDTLWLKHFAPDSEPRHDTLRDSLYPGCAFVRVELHREPVPDGRWYQYHWAGPRQPFVICTEAPESTLSTPPPRREERPRPLIFEGQYDHGRRSGIWRWYDVMGNPTMEGDYDRDTWTYWDPQGETLSPGMKGEYMSLLLSGYWYASSIGMHPLKTLHNEYREGFDERYLFLPNGEVVFQRFHADGDSDMLEGYWVLEGPSLRLRLWNNGDEKRGEPAAMQHWRIEAPAVVELQEHRLLPVTRMTTREYRSPVPFILLREMPY